MKFETSLARIMMDLEECDNSEDGVESKNFHRNGNSRFIATPEQCTSRQVFHSPQRLSSALDMSRESDRLSSFNNNRICDSDISAVIYQPGLFYLRQMDGFRITRIPEKVMPETREKQSACQSVSSSHTEKDGARFTVPDGTKLRETAPSLGSSYLVSQGHGTQFGQNLDEQENRGQRPTNKTSFCQPRGNSRSIATPEQCTSQQAILHSRLAERFLSANDMSREQDRFTVPDGTKLRETAPSLGSSYLVSQGHGTQFGFTVPDGTKLRETAPSLGSSYLVSQGHGTQFGPHGSSQNLDEQENRGQRPTNKTSFRQPRVLRKDSYTAPKELYSGDFQPGSSRQGPRMQENEIPEYNDNLRQNGRERFKPYKRCEHRSENNMKYIMDIVKDLALLLKDKKEFAIHVRTPEQKIDITARDPLPENTVQTVQEPAERVSAERQLNYPVQVEANLSTPVGDEEDHIERAEEESLTKVDYEYVNDPGF